MRVFYEHFSRNDSNSILLLHKPSLVLFERRFSNMIAPVSFCFLWSLSFLFLRKEKEKESNVEKKILKFKLNIRLTQIKNKKQTYR